MPEIIAKEYNYDSESLRIVSTNVYNTLNTDQKHDFDMVVNSVLQRQENKVFALSTSGGTNKAYLINAIIDFLHSEKKIILATALSGIAGTLLPKSQTFHSRFKVPLNITPPPYCNVSSQDATTQLFRMTNLIIVNEVSQGDKLIYEWLDHSLRDIRANESLFGGILPVVKRDSRAQIVQATLKTLYIWKSVMESKEKHEGTKFFKCNFRNLFKRHQFRTTFILRPTEECDSN
uniref:ATP-dependent DNA helicase n=1 Tax=Octopus bimaculoides TaxID=37653 RepID=A0A0L8HYU9_OCTBM